MSVDVSWRVNFDDVSETFKYEEEKVVLLYKNVYLNVLYADSSWRLKRYPRPQEFWGVYDQKKKVFHDVILIVNNDDKVGILFYELFKGLKGFRKFPRVPRTFDKSAKSKPRTFFGEKSKWQLIGPRGESPNMWIRLEEKLNK